jgi:hypothetical protein
MGNPEVNNPQASVRDLNNPSNPMSPKNSLKRRVRRGAVGSLESKKCSAEG